MVLLEQVAQVVVLLAVQAEVLLEETLLLILVQVAAVALVEQTVVLAVKVL